MGWGWDCSLHLRALFVLRKSWCWGGDVNLPWSGTHLVPRIGDVNAPCTHCRCYASPGVGVGMLTFLALAHMVDATQVMVLRWGCLRSLHLHSWLVLDKSMCWARDVNVPCACTHGWYYASHGVGLGMLTMDFSWKCLNFYQHTLFSNTNTLGIRRSTRWWHNMCSCGAGVVA